MDSEGFKDAHTAGRSGWPNSRQRPWPSNCTQATPAGLPLGMPGMALLIDGAMQQAAQPERQAGSDGAGGLKPGGGQRVIR
jgi:hypothetical protein